MNFFQPLLSPDFMPHGFCYLWDPRIVWLPVISDGLIPLSYDCIPIVLVYLIRKNRDLPFCRIFWMFETLLLACGTTYLRVISLPGRIHLQEENRKLEQEIGDRRHAEEALRASEERTGLIVETARDAVITMERRGGAVLFSRHSTVKFVVPAQAG